MEMQQENLEMYEEYMNINTGEYLGEGIFLSREYVEKKQEAQIKKGRRIRQEKEER